MRPIHFVCAVVADIPILVPSLALAGEKELRLYALHPNVGDVIDAEENEKYSYGVRHQKRDFVLYNSISVIPEGKHFLVNENPKCCFLRRDIVIQELT